MRKLIKQSLLFTKERLVLLLLSLALTLNTFLLITQHIKTLASLRLTEDVSLTGLIYFVLSILTAGTILFFQTKFDPKQFISKILLTFTVPAIILIVTFIFTVRIFPLWSYIGVHIFTVLAFIIALMNYQKYPTFRSLAKDFVPKSDINSSTKKKSLFATLAAILIFATYLGFGTYNLPKYAAVDEALWTFGRITKFWNNTLEGEWKKTMVSDKPGITVAIISGTGLLKVDPKLYEPYSLEGTIRPMTRNVEEMNFALRFPILLFSALMLLVFYFFLKRLLGTSIALISTIFIGLSPILLGISTIINPDALLWSFVPLSIINYFNYLKRKKNADLYWCAIFLGLGLLTKYVANLLIVFYFALIFIEPLFNFQEFNKEKMSAYLKKALSDYFILIMVALFVFYLLLPAAWVNLYRVLEGTLLSKAFLKVWPLFIGVISLAMADIYIFKGKFSSASIGFLARFKNIFVKVVAFSFLFFAIGTFINTYLKMRWFDLETIIASPKTSFTSSNILAFMFANFYSMIFGIIPIALVFIIAYTFKLGFFAKKNDLNERWSLYLLFFTLLYYVASTANFVSATVRYQIVIFPIVFIVAAISLHWLISKLPLKEKFYPKALSILLLLIFSIYSLNFIKPFYFSYASDLLPNEYVLNMKDMGDGSYEAAQYLNSLPSPEKLYVWTDKRGVCTFFKGRCTSALDFEKKGINIDYYVVSAGRESRTSKMTLPRINWGYKSLVELNDLYKEENPAFKLEIGGRPNNFVKVIKANTTSK